MIRKSKSRREFLKKSALLALGSVAARIPGSNLMAENVFSSSTAFELPPLPYAPDALEPFIDTQTMQIHHGKHHKAYVDNLNKALSNSGSTGASLEELMRNVSQHSTAIRNNGGGHFNHSLFWKLMSPKGGGEPTGKIAEAINGTFGSFSNFKDKFASAAMGRFGSGWTWLVIQDGKLTIGSTPNQDNPLMDLSDLKGQPLLALDVWEHAYYLKYQNKRAEYVNAFWNIVNWKEVALLMQ